MLRFRCVEIEESTTLAHPVRHHHPGLNSLTHADDSPPTTPNHQRRTACTAMVLSSESWWWLGPAGFGCQNVDDGDFVSACDMGSDVQSECSP